MYDQIRALIIGWCASGAVLMIEHLIFAPKDTPLWPRYVMGVLALLAGAFVLEWVSGRPAGALDMALISTSGVLVVAGYKFREIHTKELEIAEAIGRIDGRTTEANQAGSAGHRNN